MRTILQYDFNDLRQFVIENLKKRGYKLATGAEPKVLDLMDLDDMDTVVMSVEVVTGITGTVEPVPVQPVVKPALAATTEIKKQPDTAAALAKREAQLAKDREYRRRWEAKKKAERETEKLKLEAERDAAQAKIREQLQQAQAQPVVDVEELFKPGYTAEFTKEVLAGIQELKRELGQEREVVAPSPLPFPQNTGHQTEATTASANSAG